MTRRVIAVVGTKGPFDRLTGALAELKRRDPSLDIWVQHGEGRLPEGLAGAPMIRREALMAEFDRADVVVCHAGTGTVRDALMLGHRPVVVPRLARFGEHVNDHQLELVVGLGDRIEALTEFSTDALAAAIERVAGSRGAPGSDAGARLKEALRAELDDVAATPVPRRRPLVWRALSLATSWVPRRPHHWRP